MPAQDPGGVLHDSLDHADPVHDPRGPGGGGGMGVSPDSKWSEADVGDLVAALTVEAGNL